LPSRQRTPRRSAGLAILTLAVVAAIVWSTLYPFSGWRPWSSLRAIGFGSAGVVVSVLVETMLLAVVGALIGAAAAWLLFGGNTVSMGNQVSTLVFQVRMTPSLLGIGIVLACAVGFVGGLPPAIRASRLPAATALRAV